jgi:hypothetical protein
VNVTIAARARKGLGTALACSLAALLLALALSPGPAAAAAPCPSFRVLHDDRIGAADLPAGTYAIKLAPASGLACPTAARLFARFLEDYDGVLPKPWRVVAGGTGKASFTQAGADGFTVSRSSGGGGEEATNPSLGALCTNPFTVNSNVVLGPIVFPKGEYLLYLPAGSGISCNRAAVLFARLLASPGGRLPFPWRLRNQTATFFKPEHPVRSAFRVEALAGPGPA